MPNNISIIIADDHPILLNGLYQELKAYGYNIVAKAENGAIALDAIIKHNPKIAILDLEMPMLSGFEIIKKAYEANVQTKFIALTYHKEKSFIIQASNLNINGYLLKDEPFSEVHIAIQRVLRGETYFSKTFTSIFNNSVSAELKKINLLTPSERTILRLIAQEKTSKEIAENLHISLRTVQKHRSNIISKLDINSSSDPLSYWVKEYREVILLM